MRTPHCSKLPINRTQLPTGPTQARLTAADQRRAGVKLDEGRARHVGVGRKARVLAGVLSDEHCEQQGASGRVVRTGDRLPSRQRSMRGGCAP